MSLNLDTHKARLNIKGKTQRDRNIAGLKSDIYDLLPDNPSFKTVQVTEPNGTKAEERTMAILASDDMDIKFIKTMPDETIKCGSIIDWQDAKWLVTVVDPDYEVYQPAQMQRCNYVIRFSGENGEDVERNCIIRDVTKYLIGEHPDKMITVGSSRMSVTIAKDDQTIYLHRGTRFLIDDPDATETIAYEITKSDRVTGVFDGYGVYKFLVCEASLLETDDTSDMQPDNTPYQPGTGEEDWF